ncbi:MAG: Tyrosine--tRNA ligase [Hyphomonas sp. TMED17]|nr:MAG: Tyrosine--tRNA ligase [Hyphomonas sp. TMED17]
MGKTATGAVWLNGDRCSPYDYWQFWRNTEDADVGRFLKMFTDLSLAEIAELEKLEGAEINTAKIALANAATALLHGEAAAQAADSAAQKAFADGGVSQDLPTFQINRAEYPDGPLTISLLRVAGLVASNGEGRRKLKEGAVRINDEKILDERNHNWDDVLDTVGAFKVQIGKKRIALVHPD